MRLKPVKELAELARPFYEKLYDLSGLKEEKFERIVEIIREGAHTLKELAKLSDIYFIDKFDLPKIEEGMNKKERKSVTRILDALNSEVGKKAIDLFKQKLEKYNEEISEEEAKNILQELQDELQEGPSAVLMPLRAVLTGKSRGADLYTVISIIGKKRCLDRINQF
jgi:hypothetical protein